MCIFCGRDEDVEHAFLQCPFAQEVWRMVKGNFSLQLARRDFMSPKHWLFDFLSRATELQATVFAVGAWHIWEARNDARNNQVLPDPRRICTKILVYVDLIVQHCFKSTAGNRRVSNEPLKWTPPPPGEIMVNVDAALFTDRWQMAMGAVFRDHSGSCIAAASEPLLGFTSPELAEALALRRAVAIASSRSYVKVIFVSDCLSLIQRLNSEKPDRSPVGSVVMDIKLMVDGVSSATFRHVKRSLNEAAHILARTCDLSSVGFISNSAPEFIRETLCIDVM